LPDLAEHFGLDVPGGVIVTDVCATRSMASARRRIVAVDGKSVSNVADLRAPDAHAARRARFSAVRPRSRWRSTRVFMRTEPISPSGHAH
jgi:hypothetical protein